MIDFERARKRFRPAKLAPPGILQALAYADEFRRLLDKGLVHRQTDLARRYGITKARVSQILQLHQLHPLILEFVRALPEDMGPRYLTERRLRPLCAMSPEDQLAAAEEIIPGFQVDPQKVGAAAVR